MFLCHSLAGCFRFPFEKSPRIAVWLDSGVLLLQKWNSYLFPVIYHFKSWLIGVLQRSLYTVSFICYAVRDGTQGLLVARQLLYPWSIKISSSMSPPSPWDLRVFVAFFFNRCRCTFSEVMGLPRETWSLLPSLGRRGAHTRVVMLTRLSP